MSFPLIANLVIFIILLVLLYQTKRTNWSLSLKVFTGLVLGILFGLAINLFYQEDKNIINDTLAWTNIVGTGYIKLLQMIIMPLVLMCILNAVCSLKNTGSMGKISVYTISTLLITTFIAALIGVLVSYVFQLTGEGLTMGDAEAKRLQEIQAMQSNELSGFSAPSIILSFIPSNPFADLAGSRKTSVIGVVIFAIFLGLAALRLLKENPEKGEKVINGIETIQIWVMKLVRIVMLLTPYGVMALMAKFMATANYADIYKIGMFVLASYVGLLLMFIIHALIIGLSGINPIRYYKKVIPTLSFAFTSRSSAASIPLNIEAQTQRLGVPQSIASFAASFGATIGQNGCAGLYPAMLAVMAAPAVGIDPFSFQWILTLAIIVTLSSLGVAGVGGGATYAALIVLPILGLPITLVAILISIEPIIDMGRTALNVNGSMVAGTVTSQIMGKTDKSILNQS